MTTRDEIRMSGGLQDERHERLEHMRNARLKLRTAAHLMRCAKECGWKDVGHDMDAVEDAAGIMNGDIEKLADELEAEKLERS